MSSISSIYSNITRMSGLSGLDVESMVSSLMQLEMAKVDKVSQDRQLVLWKQEQYREITSALQGLNSEFFNSLKPASDLRSSAAYSAFITKYDGQDTNAYFSATTSSGVKAGDYTISNIITAAAAKVSGTAAGGGIAGTALTSAGINAISSASSNNKISVTFNGTVKEVTIKDNPADINDLMSDLQTKLNTAFGSDKITVGVDVDKLTFTTSNTNTLRFAEVTGNTGIASIGLSGVNTSNKIDLAANIYDIRNNFAVPLTLAGADNDISFVINNQTFSFNSTTTSLNEIMTEVNANADVGVKMSYDSLNNNFILESKLTGVTAQITSSDTNGGFLGALSLTATNVTGSDASITYNDGVNGDQVITRSTNSFTVNGINFSLKKNNAGPVTLGVSSDPTKAVELIKGFVTKYNALLDKINSKTTEKRDFDYVPLTDVQKEAMSEDQIKQWEEKAKVGLLASDGILKSIVSNMRNALVETVEGSGLTLSQIGIKSSSWLDKGKLYIDEEALKTALTNNPDEVVNLFTKSSDVLYSTAASDPTKRSERFQENGLIQRISDILQDNIRTTTFSDHRGILLEKAGAIGDRSMFNNTLFTQITNYDKRIERLTEEMAQKENSYYDQFSRLEALISNMNNQSSWLTQQFK